MLIPTIQPPARGVLESAIGFKNAVIVRPGESVIDKYNWLKSSNRDAVMGALSANNRRTLILAPGKHYINGDTPTAWVYSKNINTNGAVRTSGVTTLTFTMATFRLGDTIVVAGVGDTSFNGTFVISELVTASIIKYEQPGLPDTTSTGGTATRTLYCRRGTLTLDTDFVDICSLAGDPTTTEIISEGGSASSIYTLTQTCNDVILKGFTLRNTNDDVNSPALNSQGFNVNCTTGDNANSKYIDMIFTTQLAGIFGNSASRIPVFGTTDLKGTWWKCKLGDYAARVAVNKTAGGVWYYCIFGTFSVAGDSSGVTISGQFYYCTAGDSSWGGCTLFGCNITSVAYFEGCVGGNDCWALGKTFAATAVRCKGGLRCFAGFVHTSYPSSMTGTLIDCEASGASAGSGHSTCVNSGTIRRCRLTAMVEAMYCTGARIEDSYLQVTTADKSTLVLNDSNSKVYNSTLIANGSGKSIYAAAAKNVVSAHNRMNLGLDANVTNLVATPYDVVDSDIA